MALLLVGLPTIALVVFLRAMFGWLCRLQTRLLAGTTESKSAPGWAWATVQPNH